MPLFLPLISFQNEIRIVGTTPASGWDSWLLRKGLLDEKGRSYRGGAEPSIRSVSGG